MAHSEVRSGNSSGETAGEHAEVQGDEPSATEQAPARQTKTVTGHPEELSARAHEAEAQETRARERERPVGRGGSNRIGKAERSRLVKDAREIRFPVALRGYDRAAVDRYVRDINRLIAELEISSSPESAIRHALDEVSEETRDILQRAHQTAEELTARSRAKADDRLSQAEREAQELRESSQREAEQAREQAIAEAAEIRELATVEARELRDASLRESEQLRATATQEAARVRETAQREADELRSTARRDAGETIEDAEARARDLTHSAETIWRERRRLIEDMRAVGEQLVALGEAESKRFPRFAEEVALALEPMRGRPAVSPEPAAEQPEQQ